MACKHRAKAIRYCKTCEKKKEPHFHEICSSCIKDFVVDLDPNFMQEAARNS